MSSGFQIGVYGYGRWGVRGEPSVNWGYGVFSTGTLGATGNKTFVQPHPSDASKNVSFVCLEGNESGTYFRGTTKLINGRAEIPIPLEWQQVTALDGITVQVTVLRSFVRVAVFEKSRDKIVVMGEEDCEFDYTVNGIRRGFTKYEPYRDNDAFKPDIRGVPFGHQYPDELRDILVQNGTLNPDYTPNEETAARLGWTLRDKNEVPISERFWLTDAQRQDLSQQTER